VQAWGDRLQLNFDNNLDTVEQPKQLFNAGKQRTKTLLEAAATAYADKHQKRSGKQTLKADEAVFFQWQKQTYLSVNNRSAAFQPSQDLLVNMTTMQLGTGDRTVGILTVSNYFAV